MPGATDSTNAESKSPPWERGENKKNKGKGKGPKKNVRHSSALLNDFKVSQEQPNSTYAMAAVSAWTAVVSMVMLWFHL